MNGQKKEISQITIYFKERGERLNEVSLFEPLAKRASFDEENKVVKERHFDFRQDIPLAKRFLLNIQTFLFQRLAKLIPKERCTVEASFKTVIAMLLVQEGLRDFFFGSAENQESFLKAIEAAAKGCAYHNYTRPAEASTLEMCRELTLLSGKRASLIDDLQELNLQMASVSKNDRNKILYAILNHVRRPPLTSVLEVEHVDDVIHNITFTTSYGKCHIAEVDGATGRIRFTFTHDQATCSIRTKENSLPGMKGALNQRRVNEQQSNRCIGTYCGELITRNNVLEQILFILNDPQEECTLLSRGASYQEEMRVLFTSLYSWAEYEKVLEQHEAVRELHGKCLKIGDRRIKLSLFHHNLSFNALNKFPAPAETKAALKDLNEEVLIYLAAQHSPAVLLLAERLDRARMNDDFLARQKEVLEIVDAFRQKKGALKENLPTPLQELLFGKQSGIDALIYTGLLAKEQGLHHNKNCVQSTDRSAGANAADKAQTAFQQIRNTPYLPKVSSEEETALFKVLYSMYLVWEEPELNAGLSTGFIGEQFFNNFLQKNPETTKYLIKWLKRHPETYLGLSDYRS